MGVFVTGRGKARAARIVTRRGTEYTAEFPEMAAAPTKLRARAAILDGEVVVLDNRGRSSAALTQVFGRGRGRGVRRDQFRAVVGGLLLLLLLFVVLQPPPAVVGGLLSLFVVLPQSSEGLSRTGATGPVGDDGLQPRPNSDATVSKASTRFMDQSPMVGLSWYAPKQRFRRRRAYSGLAL